MRRVLGFALVAAFAVTGLTACSLSGDSDERRTAALGSSLPTGGGSTDIFLTVEGVANGGEMELFDYEWGGVEPSGNKPAARALTVLKGIDEASPAFYLAAAQGTQFSKAVLTVRKAGEPQAGQALLSYALDGVSVASVKLAKGGQYIEEVALTYRRFSNTIRPLAGLDGKVPSPTKSCFDWVSKVTCSAPLEAPRTPVVSGRVFSDSVDEAALTIEGLMAPEELSSGLVETNVTSFNTDVQAPAGAAAAKSPFRFTKPIDSDSPGIYKAAALGTTYKEAMLTIRGLDAGGVPQPFLTIAMTDVQVTSVKSAGSLGGHLETVSLSYKKFQVTVQHRQACFDFVGAKAC